ncbi:MAG TPA: hypothetical protein VM166_04200 [Gemmatimonadaceae bacterium]|nr:hypothetical protein [Gemmatimonadaceae bacterium]
MPEAITPILSRWETFFFMVGSSGAALTGLVFVVITLANETRGPEGEKALGAFATPNIVHFCAVLLIAAIVCVPWTHLVAPSILFGAAGLSGVIYVAVVTRRTNQQTAYKPVFEDILWHIVFPFAAYLSLLGGAVFLPRRPVESMYAIAGSALLLLFTGIHNAWDSVVYLAAMPSRGETGGAQSSAK